MLDLGAQEYVLLGEEPSSSPAPTAGSSQAPNSSLEDLMPLSGTARLAYTHTAIATHINKNEINTEQQCNLLFLKTSNAIPELMESGENDSKHWERLHNSNNSTLTA